MESVSATLRSAPAEKLSISVHPVAKTVYRTYEKAELTVTVSGGSAPYTNPFDPDEVSIDAILTGPKGQQLTIPVFWCAPYTWQESSEPDVTPVAGLQPGWRLRIAPTAPGKWSMMVRVRDHSGTAASEQVAFQVAVAAPKAHGFLRRSTGAGHARYFEFSDSTSYFPVGENICWADRRGLPSFKEWFTALHHAQGNFFRLWMEPRALENEKTGAGKYDQKNAAYFDAILTMAEENDLCCMMAFGTYGELIAGGVFNEGKWPHHPYNSKNGGPIPADKSDDFFTNPTARKLYRNRLRYMVARYGAFTSLGFWELWNEKAGPADWFAEMARYLKETDAHQRPVTNSYQITGPAEVWNIPDLDLTQTHRYGDEGSIRDITSYIPGDARVHDPYKKPHLLGEFGINWRGPDIKFDEKGTGTNIHNGLWSSALAGNAGSAMVWWWDNYVAPKNLYGTFTGLARFSQAIDWSHRAFEPLDLPNPVTPQSATLHTQALQDQKSAETLVWLQDPESNWASDREGKAPAQWESVKLSIPMPHPGTYHLEWWDTRTGKVISKASLKTEAIAGEKSVRLQPTAPAFQRDIALRVVGE